MSDILPQLEGCCGSNSYERRVLKEAADEITRLRKERDSLGKAIRDAAVEAVICREDVALTGPDLLMLCADLSKCVLSLREEVDRLKAEADPEGLAIAHEVGYQRNRTQLLAAQLSERKLRDLLGRVIEGDGTPWVDLIKEIREALHPINTDEADKLIKALEVAKDAMELATTFKWPYLNEMRQAIATIEQVGIVTQKV